VSVFAFQWLLGGPITLVPNQVFLPAVRTGMVPPEILGLMGNPILLEFIVGMLLACAFVRFGPLLRHGRAAWASRVAALVLTGVFLHSYLSPLDPGNGLLHKGFGAVCLVVAGLLLEASRPRSLAGPLAGRCLAVGLWLGAISYPLYLIHLGIADKLVRRASSLLLGLRVDGVVGFLALAAASLALASAIHVGVERYLIRAGKALIALRHRRARAAS
jgi:peptidoglycan/LPS O-acetylase OafA/YrhL